MYLLILDDDLETIELVEGYLNERGHTLDSATNSKDFYKLLKSNVYDALLIDLMLPLESGIEILKVIKDISTPKYLYTDGSSDFIPEVLLNATYISKEKLSNLDQILEEDS